MARACAAEALGTFLLVFIGTGVVATAIFTGAQAGLWQVATVWGIGVTLAIYATAGVSGAHLNPAVTLAFALRRPHEFPARNVAPYWAAQLFGSVVAGLLVLAIFSGVIAGFEAAQGLVRGAPGSERAAMAFGEYFPNPAMYGGQAEAALHVDPWAAAAAEGLATALLVFTIFAVVDRRNTALPAKHFAPCSSERRWRSSSASSHPSRRRA